MALWWRTKHYNAIIDLTSSTKIILASTIAALITYAVIPQLNLANWIALTLGALIYLTAYMITASLIGAINKTDTQNLKEMLKGLAWQKQRL